MRATEIGAWWVQDDLLECKTLLCPPFEVELFERDNSWWIQPRNWSYGRLFFRGPAIKYKHQSSARRAALRWIQKELNKKNSPR